MRIALVWGGRQRLADLSFRYELYAAAFRELGHEVRVVTYREAAEDAPLPVESVESREALTRAAVWQRFGADIAVVITWHRLSSILRAIREAGTQVVAVADSDGLVGLRAYPRMTLERMLVYRHGWRRRLGCLKYWGWRQVTDRLGRDAEDREFLESTRCSDVVLFVSRPAIDAFRRFLRYHREEEALGPRLRAVPYAVPTMFCDYPLSDERADRLVAVGRWTDPQKNAPLLIAALERYLAARASEVVVFGSGGRELFGPLAARFPSIRLEGPRDPDEVTRTLAGARSIVFSSRWETGPHAATEALALGCSIVGTRLPNLLGLTEDGRYGSIAAGRGGAALAEALGREAAAWDEGRRSPSAIAGEWRSRLHPQSVGRQMLAALTSAAGGAPRRASVLSHKFVG